jgi:hypothetical protein
MKDAIIKTLIDLTFEEHLGFGHLGQQILNRPKIVNVLTIEVLLHMFCLGVILFTFPFQHLNDFLSQNLILMGFSTETYSCYVKFINYHAIPILVEWNGMSCHVPC